MGGGMRQAGILAAAGLLALTEHPSLLAEDHRRARELEKALAEIPGITVEQGNINMVFFYCLNPAGNDPARTLVDAFRRRGIIINAPEQFTVNGENRLLFRFVTHHWIGEEELVAIIEASRLIFDSVGLLQ